MKNKRAWIRIAEAVFAIMIIASVVIILYERNIQRPDLSEQVYELQMRILDEIALKDDLREAVLDGDEITINNSVAVFIPLERFDFEIRICNMADACSSLKSPVDKDVFVEERFIAGTIEEYSPKKVRIFIWEK